MGKDGSIRESLEDLVERAQDALEELREYTTVGDQEALQDMIGLAERTLRLEQPVFVRNREFLHPSEDEQLSFAVKRFTMVPTYPMITHYGFYGLEEALRWFRGRDVRYAADLEDISVIERCRAFLAEARPGTGVGEYDEAAIEQLKACVARLEHCQAGQEKAGIKVVALNALNTAKKKCLYVSDVEPESNPFFTKGELDRLKKSIETDGYIRRRYLEIRKKADEVSLAVRKEAYEESMAGDVFEKWNADYGKYAFGPAADRVLFGRTEKNINFRPPAKSRSARVRFRLPALENEQDGLGHVWIDNIVISSGSGEKAPIENSGFEEGLTGWRALTEGNAEISVEERRPYCGTEFRSLCMRNPDPASSGTLIQEELWPILEGEVYSFMFDGKVDGKLKEGLWAEILFYDEQGKELGSFTHAFNRKTFIDCMAYNLSMQCDALVYALTGEVSYAWKTKYEILHFLNNFCQGAEYWLYTNERPEGSDAYGAVQGGRNLCSIAFAYAQIKDSKVFNVEEKKQLYGYIDYLLRYMLDLRDRSVLTYEQAQENSSNWQTDMCIGTIMILLVLSDFPNRKAWINNAYAVIRGQLENKINGDGSWPESIRYHHAALERFACFAKVWKAETGENLFRKTRLLEMFAYSIDMQTPPYVWFDGKIGTPPFGDHRLGDGEEYALLGSYLDIVAESDRQLADRMYMTWKRAGYPHKKLWGESLIADGMESSPQSYRPETKELCLAAAGKYPDSGIYIFRNRVGGPKEEFFAIMSSPKPVGHGHLDQGSFMIYKDCVPIVMDSGVEGYFDASTPWHLCSYSHAVLQFQAQVQDRAQGGGARAINLSPGNYSLERGWLDVPRSSSVAAIKTGGREESITIEIDHPEGSGRHIRQVICNHEEGSYLIQDRIEGFAGKVLMSIPVVSRCSRIQGNRIISTGYYHVSLITEIRSEFEKVWVERGRTTPMFPTEEEVPMLEYIRVVAAAGEGFVTKLLPVVEQ